MPGKKNKPTLASLSQEFETLTPLTGTIAEIVEGKQVVLPYYRVQENGGPDVTQVKYPSFPDPLPNDLLSDGICEYVVDDDPKYCVSVNPPGLLFKVPPPGFYVNLGRVSDNLEKFQYAVTELTSRLKKVLPRVLQNEGIDNDMQVRFITNAVMKTIHTISKNL